MILLCYDGSADAQAAIEHAGTLFGGQAATVLTVWEPLIDVLARTGAGRGFGAGVVELDTERIDAASEEAARERAEEGTEHARQVGLEAEPRTSARAGTIGDTILGEAVATKAEAVVMGTRGLTGLKSLLLGSVSHAVLQQADRPVVVIPSAELASERAARRD